MIDQDLFLSNQITGFFHHQHLWKVTINILDFFCVEIVQRKISSKSTIVGWVRSDVPSYAQTCLKLSGIVLSWSGGC